MSCTLCATRVSTSQAVSPPSHSTLTGAELSQAKKKKKKKILCLYMQGHFGRVQLFVAL